MIESALPLLPKEIWKLIGEHVIDSSSKKKLRTNIPNFITVFFDNSLKTAESTKGFIIDAAQPLFEYSLKTKKLTFLDFKFNSREEEISFLIKNRDSLGIVQFEVPLYSLDEIRDLCEQAELTKISLKANLVFINQNAKKILALPKIEKFKLRCHVIDQKSLKEINADSLSLSFGLDQLLTFNDLKNLRIKSLRTGGDVLEKAYLEDDEVKKSDSRITLKKLTFYNDSSFPFYFEGYYKNLDIRKLRFKEIKLKDFFFEQLRSLKNLSSLAIWEAQNFKESDLLKLPSNLQSVSLRGLALRRAAFNLPHLKYLDISKSRFSNLNFLSATLKALVLSFENVSWPTFKRALPHLKLKHLQLSRLDVPKECYENLKSQKNLRTLKLKYCTFIKLEKLASLVKEVGLRHLTLKTSIIDGIFSEHFENISLQTLDISDTPIPITDLRLLSLRTLTINTKLTDIPDSESDILLEDNWVSLQKIKGLIAVIQNQTIRRIQNPNA